MSATPSRLAISDDPSGCGDDVPDDEVDGFAAGDVSMAPTLVKGLFVAFDGRGVGDFAGEFAALGGDRMLNLSHSDPAIVKGESGL